MPNLSEFYSLYDQFLGYFPAQVHGAISLVLAGILVYAIFQVVKKNFVYIIILVILLPQAQPMLKSIWENAVQILQFLMKR